VFDTTTHSFIAILNDSIIKNEYSWRAENIEPENIFPPSLSVYGKKLLELNQIRSVRLGLYKDGYLESSCFSEHHF
jgi:hypothetical protein